MSEELDRAIDGMQAYNRLIQNVGDALGKKDRCIAELEAALKLATDALIEIRRKLNTDECKSCGCSCRSETLDVARIALVPGAIRREVERQASRDAMVASVKELVALRILTPGLQALFEARVAEVNLQEAVWEAGGHNAG